VKEELRGRGIGTQILQFLEAYLRKKGYRLLLSSSMVNEARPQHWHRKMGFEECGVITGLSEEGVGEIFFRKRLGP
jgi:ribosomal protein S18 acetylase RimI-like enzyme